MTQAERVVYASDRNNHRLQPRKESNVQGARIA